MNVVEWLIGAGFLSIFVITIMKEFKLLGSWWSQLPFLYHLIPSWSFFAPNPYHTDYYILVRFIEKGEVKHWNQAYDLTSMRRPYSFLWNPQKWHLKTIADVCIDLLKVAAATKRNKTSICLSVPYLSILNWVQAKKSPQAEKIQFVIMCKGDNGPEALFVSETHPV